MIYADHNATSPLASVAKEAILAIMDLPLNASSLHSLGQEGRRLVEGARNTIKDKLGVTTKKILFTSSGTEANNMLIQGLGDAHQHCFSAVEHKSIIECAKKGATTIPVDENGILDLAFLASVLRKSSLLSVMTANNETGIIQPIEKIAEICHDQGAYLHTDAAQAIGKIDFAATASKVDAISFSGHKIGGGLGSGVLAFEPQKISFKPLMTGGGQEGGLRAGTENTLAIAALGAAMADIERMLNHNQSVILDLRNRLEKGIMTITGGPHLIIGHGVERLPNTSYILMPNTNNATQIIYFDQRKIAVSSGSACSSGTVQNSHVLEAMKVNPNLAGCAIRFSFGPGNNQHEIDYILNCWEDLYRKNN